MKSHDGCSRTSDTKTLKEPSRPSDVDSAETKTERDVILDSIHASGYAGQKSTPMKALFTHSKTQHFRRMMLGAASQSMQQVGGCNAVIYYSPILFEKSIGETHNISMLLGGVNMIVYSIFVTVSWLIIELVIVFACLIPGTKAAAKGAAVCLFTYIASFGTTWLPVPWLYPAEINPVKTRGKANVVSTCTNWLFNFLIVMITPILIHRISWGTYLLFACINSCFFPILRWFYPETANRSLEEIAVIFAKGYVEGTSYVKAAEQMSFLTLPMSKWNRRQYDLGLSTPLAKEVWVRSRPMRIVTRIFRMDLMIVIREVPKLKQDGYLHLDDTRLRINP
ncbi:Fc.00g079390.m01.CDS01 [Cosmosporella sp. VM-42]